MGNLLVKILWYGDSLAGLIAHLNFVSGTTVLHNELEEGVARFVGKPAAIVFGMGYVTNSAILPVLIGKVCIL